MKPYAPGLNVMCEGSEGASDLSNWRRSFPRLCDGLRDKKRSMLSPRALLSGVDGAGKFSEKDENLCLNRLRENGCQKVCTQFVRE